MDETTLATPSAGDIAEAVGLAIPSFFGDAFDQFVQGEAGYLANGEPKGAIAQIGQAVGRSACRRYGAGQAGVTGAASARYERACRPYLDTLSPSDGLGLKPPFEGLQCPVEYRFRGSGSSEIVSCSSGALVTTVSSNPSSTLIRAFGPIRSVSVEGRTPTNCGFDNFRLRIIDGSGATLLSPVIGSPTAGPLNRMLQGSLGYTVTRVDGAADNCGNPDPVAVPVPPIADPTPPPFRFNPVPGIDVGVDVTVAPDGKITFDIGTGPITVDPFPDGGDGGDGGSGGPPPGDVGAPGAPEGTGVGGEAEGEAPPGRALTGINVAITQFPPSRDTAVGALYRAAYYAYLGVPGLLDLDPAGSLARQTQFIFAEKDNLTAWRVSANPGYAVQVTPYYREV